MTNCPVCNISLSEQICPSCGYDASRDYARFPTFAPLAPGTPAPSRQAVLRCRQCGSTRFSLRLQDRVHICADCGATLDESAIRAQGSARITAIAAGDSHLVGLRADGAVLAVGTNDDGQCNTDQLAEV